MLIKKVIQNKSDKLNSGNYRLFSKNWLFIYSLISLSNKEQEERLVSDIKQLQQSFDNSAHVVFNKILIYSISSEELYCVDTKRWICTTHKVDQLKYSEKLKKLSRKS